MACTSAGLLHLRLPIADGSECGVAPQRFDMRWHRAILGAAIAAFTVTLGVTVVVRGEQDRPPSDRDVAFATEVSDLMVNELVAALFTEFDETTPQNVPHGKQAISLIFNDLNRNMRLIGTFGPLLGGENDRPADRFEARAMRARSRDRPSPTCRK